MDFHINAVATNLWFIQTVAMTLLTGGFVVYDMSLWERAFVSHTHSRHYRIALILVPLLFSAIMLYGGYLGRTESVAFINAGLFGLTIPLFDERIRPTEYLARAAIVLGVWLPVHWFNLTQPFTILGSFALLGVLGAICAKPGLFRFHPVLLITTQTGLAALFWLTLPWQHEGISMTPTLAWQSVLMYSIISSYTAIYWYSAMRRHRQNQQLEALAAYDAITTNQQYQKDQDDMHQLLSHAHQVHYPLTVVALDVDNFQQFNRQYGHMAGNATLIALLELLERHLHVVTPEPHLYYSSGEEFTIAFPNTTAKAAAQVIEAYLDAVRKTAFPVKTGTANLTISAGITTVLASDVTIDTVYKRADDNLYLSKKRGRDVYTCDGQTNLPAHSQAQLAFFAQPIVVDLNGHLEKAANELLLRNYNQNTKQWSLPQRFDIDVEVQIALIRQALRQSDCQRVTVNLTAEQFEDTVTATALAGFTQADYGPELLTVEITSIPDLATTRRVTALYRDAGIRILIDDVGSDNSFELVRKLLPYVDGVKFAIQNLRRQESLNRIQERIAFWAETTQANDLTLILEGVETPADLAFARSLGIRYFQGYYFGKPENLAA